MTENKFLIKSWGRAGNTYVKFWIANYNNCIAFDVDNRNPTSQELLLIKNPLQGVSISSHSDWVPKNSIDFFYIHVKRKNVFDQIISRLVAKITKQTTKYNAEIYSPQYIELEFFHKQFISLVRHNYVFDAFKSKYPWKEIYTLYYEDFIADEKNLNFLKISQELSNSNRYQSFKNPRNNTELIENYNELKEFYINNCNYLDVYQSLTDMKLKEIRLLL